MSRFFSSLSTEDRKDVALANANGISWLPGIPPGWRITRFKNLFQEIYRYPTYYNIEYVSDGIPEVRGEALTPEGFIMTLDDERYISNETNKLFPRTQLQLGDIVMSVRGTMGKIGVVDERYAGANITANLLRLSPDQRWVASNFLRWVMRSTYFDEALNCSAPQTTIKTITMPQLAKIPMALPPKNEQQRIAAYLDASCSAIDAAVAAKRRQLETLDALRKSTIKRAVTLGLNPSVKTRRTDVEWIPEMPQHWRLVRAKDVMEFFNTVRVPLSAAERGVMTEKTYDYYGASGVIDKVEAYLFDGTYILIAEDGANLLTRSKPLAFLAKGQFWVNNHAHILKPRWGGDDTFFVNLLESQDFSLFVTGAAQPKLTMENLGRFKLAVPRVAEQKEIAAFIQEKDAEFRPLFAQIEQQIETLVAYRKSLIHECVTGQRRIMEADVTAAQRVEPSLSKLR